MECDYRQLLIKIKAKDVPAFRICPISCYQYPVIYFLSPYPEKMLPFIDHTVAHEILHLKHAFFRIDRCPYFTKKEDINLWNKAGYNAFPLEELFEDLVNKYGVENTFALTWDYGERFRDFFIEQELLKSSFFLEATKKWEMHELFVTTREKMLKYLRKYDTFSIYVLKLLALDTGIKLILLSQRVSPKKLRERPVFPESYSEGEKIVEKGQEMFRSIKYISDPFVLAKKIVKLDEFVGLSKLLQL